MENRGNGELGKRRIGETEKKNSRICKFVTDS